MSISDLVLTVLLRATPDFIRANFASLVLIDSSIEAYNEELHSRLSRPVFMHGSGYPVFSSCIEGIGEVRSVFVGLEYEREGYVFLTLRFVGVLVGVWVL